MSDIPRRTRAVPRVCRSGSNVDPTTDDDEEASDSTHLLKSDERSRLLGDSCTETQQLECSQLLREYQSIELTSDEDSLEEFDLDRDEYQITRHLVLILMLLVSQFVVSWSMKIVIFYDDKWGIIILKVPYVNPLHSTKSDRYVHSCLESSF